MLLISSFFEHDLIGKLVPTHRVVARGHAFTDYALEYRAVADDFYRGRSVGAAVARQRSARGPGSALENFRQRQRGGIERKSMPHAIGDAVEQRHRERAPFHDQR